MSTALDDIIIERIGFLQEQIDTDTNDDNIRTFQAQIRVLLTAQLDRLNELIEIRRKDLEASKNVFEADRLFAELETLEWLQRQARQHS